MQVKCPYCKTEFHHKRRDVLTCPACKEMFHLSEEEMAQYPEDDTAEEEMCQNLSDSPVTPKKKKKNKYDPVYRYYNLYACAIGFLCIFGVMNKALSLFSLMIGINSLFVSIHFGSIVLKYGEARDKVIAWIINFVAIICLVVIIILFILFLGLVLHSQGFFNN